MQPFARQIRATEEANQGLIIVQAVYGAANDVLLVEEADLT